MCHEIKIFFIFYTKEKYCLFKIKPKMIATIAQEHFYSNRIEVRQLESL